MMTKVKKNSQNIKGFTKPSHIECAVQFRNQTFLPKFHKHTILRENNLYLGRKDRGLTEIHKYMSQIERMYRGHFGGIRFF
jgi:hypothetical protein